MFIHRPQTPKPIFKRIFHRIWLYNDYCDYTLVAKKPKEKSRRVCVMAFQSSITSVPPPSVPLFPCKSLLSKASCSPSSFVNYSSRSSSSLRNLTSCSTSLPLLGLKSKRTDSFRCFASGTLPLLSSFICFFKLQLNLLNYKRNLSVPYLPVFF